jgi:hypothetical protein
MSLESDGGIILAGENRRTRRKTCSSATLPTTNLTWIGPGAKPGLRCERPATNYLSHGKAPIVYLVMSPWRLAGLRTRNASCESSTFATCVHQRLSHLNELAVSLNKNKDDPTVIVAVYGVVSPNAYHTLRLLQIYCASPSEF